MSVESMTLDLIGRTSPLFENDITKLSTELSEVVRGSWTPTFPGFSASRKHGPKKRFPSSTSMGEARSYSWCHAKR